MPASRLRLGLAALAALLLVYVTAQAVNPPGAPSDHFLAFKAKRAKGAAKFVAIPGVRLVDGFEDLRFDLKAAGDLLPPVGENGAAPSDAATHLRAYKLKAVKGSPKHVKRLRVPILNHLGSWRVDTTKPDLLLVPTAVHATVPPSPPDPSAHQVDHYKCYLVKRSKDGAKIPKGLQTTVTDPYTGAAKVLGVRALKRLCLPVDKEGEGVENPAGVLACFTVKLAKGQPKHVAQRALQTNNQLGPLVLDTVKENELCVPSTIPAPTPTPGGPTATSATPGPTGAGSPTPTPDLPPDPEDVAPEVDAAVASVAAFTTRFLYEGADPIQTGVGANAIDDRRAAVVRGRVLDQSGAPLAGVRITILAHPELGETLTRADGVFDLVVNGGAMITVRYEKPPFLPVQRQADVPWQEFVTLPDVMLTPLDAAVTAIDLGMGVMQAARGSVVTDADGTRQATLLLPAGTTAMMIDAQGQEQPIGQLAIRATEFTVGANGPQSMPGDLPASSAYTYAVELSADEAIAAGAREVVFSAPIFHYVENFLEFPVGTVVPTGFYDRERGVWEASANGLVIAIVAETGGLADLDLDGNGTADDGTAIGVTDAERQQLAALYAPGQELWRVPIPHFSIVDCNWPFVLPDDATAPGSPPAVTDASIDQCVDEQAVASIVECQNQTLGQSVPIVGTPFALNYRSDRVPGREGARTVRLVASGATVPASLERIDVELQVAGQRLTQTVPPDPDQTVTFTWDGLDAYGRALQGSQPFRATIGWVYDGVYSTPAEAQQAFAAFGSTPISSDRAREQITVGQVLTGALGGIDARGTGLGGWTLDVHHAYDPEAKVVYLGNGRRLGAGAIRSGVVTIAGGGSTPATTGIEAKSALFSARPFSLIFTADGALFFSIPDQHRIGRVTPDGILSIFGGGPGFGGDGQLLGFAQFTTPLGITVGADGVGYIADSGNHRIRRVEPSGIISTFAGNGSAGFSGDDGPALAAELDEPDFVAVGPDGSVYVSDGGNDRIRRIGTDGIISTIAGGGATCCNDIDGIPALDAALNNIGGLVVDAKGVIYIASDDTILRLGPDGILSRIAGDFFSCDFIGDDGPALMASLCQPTGLALDRDGRLYVGDRGNDRVRVIGPDGIIGTVLGGGADGTTEEAPATQAALANALGPAIAPDGSLHAVGTGPNRIRRLQSSLPAFAAAAFSVASEDAGSIYQFDAVGRHLQTIDSLTGGLIYQFSYDGDGRLAQVFDGDFNTTTIVRDANGAPTSIVGPFGQETTLALDANGFLAAITNPANETVAMTYTPAGLLTTFTDPLDRVATYDYDDLGRLESAEDPAGGSLALARTEIADGHESTRTTELGRISTDRVERSAAGNELLTSTLPDGSGRAIATDRDGLQTTNFAHGTATTSVSGPDPRFGLESPVATSFSTHLPSTLAFEGSGKREAVIFDPEDPFSLQTLTQTTTVNGKTSVSTYATVSRTFTSTTAAGRTHTATLDDRGRLVQSQVGDLDPVSVAYDGSGRIATTAVGSGPGARTTTFTYDDDGYLDTITDPLDRVASFAWDAAGRLTAKTLPDGKVVGFGYDAAGNATSVTPPGRGAYVHAYSPRNELTIFTPPAAAGSGPTTIGYDTDRAVASVDRGGVHTAAIAYDTAGRPATRTQTSGGGAPAIDTFAYDGVGRLATITAANGVVFGYGYDGILPVTSTWSGSVTGTVGRTYDTTFRLASQSVNGANPIAFDYDDDGLLTSAGDLVIARDPENGLGTGTTLGVVATTRTFNGAGEMTSYAATENGSPLFAQTYTRDALGRVTTKVETIAGVTDTYTYGFDLAGQLTSVLKNGNPFESHVYDTNGNRTSATVDGDTDGATYDALDRLTTQGGVTFTHDAAGDRVDRTAGSDTTTYEYDAVGNLVAVGLPDGTAITYLVDGVGRRVGRSVDGTLVQGLLYDDLLRPIAELDGAGAVVSRFVYSNGTTPAYMLKGGATLRIVADQVGSVRLVVNAATGAVVQRLDYDAFGNVLADSSPGFQPFGFAGGLYDPATQLVHFGVRDYDPETGRWTARDPLGFRGNDHNLYRYCANDPVNRLDPSGLDNWDAAIGFIEQMNEEIQMVNPFFALNVLVDSAVKGVASALGFDPGPTMREIVFHSGPTIADRKSEDYATGELAAVCVGTIGQLATGAAAEKLLARAAIEAETLARQARIAERIAARDGEKIPFKELRDAAADIRNNGQRFAHEVQEEVVERVAGWRTGGGGNGILSGGGW